MRTDTERLQFIIDTDGMLVIRKTPNDRYFIWCYNDSCIITDFHKEPRDAIDEIMDARKV